MRSKVFRHIQRMPLAFFTRTQTGALVSRLNNDVIGAQQAFTDLLSNVVGNLVTVVIVLGAMFFLSWQITLAALILLPVFLIPARFVGQRIGSLTKEGYNLNAEMNMVMQERFNVGGAMLVKLLGRPEAEAAAFEDKAGRVRDIGIAQATYARIFFVALTLTASLATAIVYGFGGVAAVHGALDVGTVVALTAYLTRLYGPLTQLSNLNLDVMTALVSFERLFEVLDIVPMIEEDPDAVAIPAGRRLHRVRPRRASPTRAPRRSRWPRWSRWPCSSRARGSEVLHDVSFTVEPGQMVALVGPRAPARRPSRPGPPPLRRHGRVGPLNGVDVRHATMASVRDVVGVVTQDPHLFHDTLRANLHLRPARGDRGRGPRRPRPGPDRPPGRRSARRARHRDRRARLPALGRREAAGRPGPPHAQGARRRGARRGHRPPRLRVRGRGAAGPARDAERAAPRWSSPTGSPRSARPTSCWSSTGAASSSGAPTPACWPRTASTPSSTGPSSPTRKRRPRRRRA